MRKLSFFLSISWMCFFCYQLSSCGTPDSCKEYVGIRISAIVQFYSYEAGAHCDTCIK